MKTLSAMFILVLALYFSGCSTQTGGTSVSSAPTMSDNPAQSSSVKNTSGSGGDHEGNTGPDASDSEIAYGPHS